MIRELSLGNFDRLFLPMKLVERLNVPLHGTRSPVRSSATLLANLQGTISLHFLSTTQRLILPELFPLL